MDLRPGAGRPPEFRDRRRGLAVFGVLAVGVGAFATCFATLTPLAPYVADLANQSAASSASGAGATAGAGAAGAAIPVPRPDPRGLIIATIFYVGLAALFITLGVGSLRARRWVRPIALVTAWIWLACGVLGLVSWLILLPTFPAAMRAARPAEAPVPDDMMRAVTLTASLFLLLIYVALPSLFVWFYNDRDVKLTLERADPVPRWTDACPLPVLGMSLALAAAAAAALAPLAYGAVPALGSILTGPAAVLFCGALAVSAATLARGAYRLRAWSWWGTLALVIVVHAGSLAAFLRADMAEVYTRMHMPAEDIALMRAGGLLSGSAIVTTTAAIGGASLIYLLFVRKYFRSASDPRS